MVDNKETINNCPSFVLDYVVKTGEKSGKQILELYKKEVAENEENKEL